MAVAAFKSLMKFLRTDIYSEQLNLDHNEAAGLLYLSVDGQNSLLYLPLLSSPVEQNGQGTKFCESILEENEKSSFSFQ